MPSNLPCFIVFKILGLLMKTFIYYQCIKSQTPTEFLFILLTHLKLHLVQKIKLFFKLNILLRHTLHSVALCPSPSYAPVYAGLRRVAKEWPTALLLLLLLLLLLSSSSSSSSSPLYRVFIVIFLRQTMSLGNTLLQLFCCYYSWCLYCYFQC